MKTPSERITELFGHDGLSINDAILAFLDEYDAHLKASLMTAVEAATMNFARDRGNYIDVDIFIQSLKELL